MYLSAKFFTVQYVLGGGVGGGGRAVSAKERLVT